MFIVISLYIANVSTRNAHADDLQVSLQEHTPTTVAENLPRDLQPPACKIPKVSALGTTIIYCRSGNFRIKKLV